MTIKRGCFIALLTLLSSGSLADEPPAYDRITLSVSAGREVENDTLVGILYAQEEGDDPGRLARDINRTLGKAVARAKQIPGIRVQTLGYSTTPVYRKQSLSGWRVRQSLRLESLDSTALSELVGELQASLAVDSISYGISPGRLKAAEDELIGEAIAAFGGRAQKVARELGRSGYRLVRMNLNTPGQGPPPVPLRGVAMALREDAAPPALEAGSRRVEVNIDATIELHP